MKIADREYVLAVMTAGVALFGITALLARPQAERWRDRQREIREAHAALDASVGLIATRPQWTQRFEELSRLLPKHPAGAKIDVYWMSQMDQIAATHGLRIKKREVGAEEQAGDVYELAIEVKDWDGTLDSLVRFLFDLQARGATFDVRQLYVKPDKGDMLAGRFTLYCVYTRDGAGG